jgi:hypothetical protein
MDGKIGSGMTYLLELLDGSLVDTTTLVDQVTSLKAMSATCLENPARYPGGVRQARFEVAVKMVKLTVVDLPESTCPITTTLR